MSNYYAVRVGRVPGIYNTWDLCRQQVSKFSGAVHHKFRALSDAEAFLKNMNNQQTAKWTNSRPDDASLSFKSLKPPKAHESKILISDSSKARNNSPSKKRRSYSPTKLGNHNKIQGKRSFSTSSSSSVNNNNNNGDDDGSENISSPSKITNLVDECAFSTDEDITEYSNTELDYPMKKDSIVVYVDGGCDGNQSVHNKICPAGWGVVILHVPEGECEKNARLVTELYGPVILDSENDYYLGATVGSNNTAELTALGEAMLWLRDHFAECFPNKLSNQGITVHIRFDSEYAAKSILGIYNGPKNKMLISNIRKLYNDVRNQEKVETIPCYDSSHEGNITALKFNLHFSHVKGHSKNKWNDAVDLLATKGKSGHVGVGGRYQNLSNAPVTSSSFVSNTEIIQSKNSESDLKVDETSTTIVLDSDIETDPKAKTKTKPKRSSKSESQSLKDKPSEVMVIDSENETAPTKDAEVILKPHRRSLTNRIRSRSNSSSPQN